MAAFGTPEYEAIRKDLHPGFNATDKQLAVALVTAKTHGNDEDVILALDTILVRLQIPLDESEQGLTPRASKAVDEFVEEHFTS